jgi:hypothetical protein
MPRLKYFQANALAASALRKSSSHGLTFQQNTRVQYLYGDVGVSEKRRVLCIRVDNDLQSTAHTVLNARKQGDNCAAIQPAQPSRNQTRIDLPQRRKGAKERK